MIMSFILGATLLLSLINFIGVIAACSELERLKAKQSAEVTLLHNKVERVTDILDARVN